ncbi:hypothetical protein GQ54DRAFT_1762 [Martensiomyces pterosporus]|nr:hypothetical protein GQ54DRAFT_1762 [Martensiomyces pterosporus]
MELETGHDSDHADLLAKHSDIVPRQYQLGMLRRALDNNTIVMLETGTGKTLIAVMLIEWFSRRTQTTAHTSTPRQRKKSRVFLNNTVALVHQQARVIAENTEQRVHSYTGSTGVDEWGESAWQAKWGAASVHVMTHQILLNALRSGFVRLSDIDLLVFDECHHARGNHPYSLIMREFYDHCPQADRPHIFGMTASPLNARETADVSVNHLQAALDSNLCTVDLMATGPLTSMSRPSSVVYEYALPPRYETTRLTLALKEECGRTMALENAFKTLPVIMSLLGPFGVDQMWHHFIHRWLVKTRQTALPRSMHARNSAQPATLYSAMAEADSDYDYGKDGTDKDTASGRSSASPLANRDAFALQSQIDKTAALRAEVLDLVKALEIDREFGGDAFKRATIEQLMATTTSTSAIGHLGAGQQASIRAQAMQAIPHLIPTASRLMWDEISSELTPQVNRLLGILYEWRTRSDELRGIVFTTRRLTAIILVYVISKITEFEFVRPDVLLGASQGPKSSMAKPIRAGSAKSANQQALADFAVGKINLLVATQVAEEGVDIQPCNLVIRFEMPKTATSMIQSRGRARKEGSQFVVMVPLVEQPPVPALAGDSPDSTTAAAAGWSAASLPMSPGLADSQQTAIAADSNSRTLPPCMANTPAPKEVGTYTDYLKLVALEECLREWCMQESQLEENKSSDGIITKSRTHLDYGMLLRKHRLVEFSDENPEDDTKELWIESRDRTGRIYTVVASQAKITYLSAIPVVHQYVQALPQDPFFMLKPEFKFRVTEHYESQAVAAVEEAASAGVVGKKNKVPKPKLVQLFSCAVTLPANAAIRQVAGPAMPNKKLAKQVAAYRMAKKLHQIGAIDDNMLPVVVSSSKASLDQGTGGTSLGGTLQGAKKGKGTRASVNDYEIAVPHQFLHRSRCDTGSEMAVSGPTTPDEFGIDAMEADGDVGIVVRAAPATFDSSDEDATLPGSAEAATPSRPRFWHLYRIDLQNASTSMPARLILATAQALPETTVVPLYIAQYLKNADDIDTSATPILPVYVGPQLLCDDQVDALASFTSKLLLRITGSALVWDTDDIGVLLGPPLEDGLGIDFGVAATCFKNRDAISKRGLDEIDACEGCIVMDALDFGKLKVIERVCSSIDIYSDLTAHHAAYSRSQQTEGTVAEGQLAADMDMGCESPANESALSSSASIASTSASGEGRPKMEVRGRRHWVRTMARWAEERKLFSFLPRKAAAASVPVFKVGSINIALNYLHVSIGQSLPPQQTLLETEQVYPDGIYTSPFFCAPESLDLDDIYNLSLLPSFFARLDQVLLAEEVRQMLGLDIRTELVRQAITASSASMDVNYERLETLGDSVLKYITTTMLFVTRPGDHEGLLTARRDALVNNAHLFALAQRQGLAEYIISQVYSRREWRLPGIGWKRLLNVPLKWICTPSCEPARQFVPRKRGMPELLDDSTAESEESGMEKSMEKKKPPTRPISTTRPLSEKMVADIIESLLGAAVLDGGIEGALAAARSLGVVGESWSSWSQFATAWDAEMRARQRHVRLLSERCVQQLASIESSELTKDLLKEIELDRADVIYGQPSMFSPLSPQLVPVDGHGAGSSSWAEEIEEILGYTFKSRDLLAEALTHCSSIDLGSSSYQRLEYLGDAVLDYVVTKRYFDYTPHLNPHRITLVKHVAVSNDVLALVLVCHKLHRFIRHRSDFLGAAIHDYEVRLERARTVWTENGGSGGSAIGDAEDIYKDLPPECWNLVQAPKVLGDIFESLLGAIYVDSGMSHEAATAAYKRLLGPFLDKFVDSGKLTLNPIIQSLLVCQAWGCQAFSWEHKQNANLLDIFNKYICEFKIHKHTVVAAMGESPRHAKYNAASEFLRMVGAVAPNTLYGDLSALSGPQTAPAAAAAAATATAQVVVHSELDKILKPLCSCLEERQAAMAAAEAGAKEDGE